MAAGKAILQRWGQLQNCWALELAPSKVGQAPLPEFQVGDLVIDYWHRVGGRAHKVDSLWIGPLEVTFKRAAEYTVKPLLTGCPLARSLPQVSLVGFSFGLQRHLPSLEEISYSYR
ncbi:hypothetical protein DSO57_1028091 [Entomophthora muscae]|uniref:Uncharacterized protein n=1 Tax=Entomophthora muscae TaxID=34485 RepID=A0ACC2T1L6_9FUNG|nr:hypothetical protein DSO57_1028091 [Entomophthora muscae]